jgi:Rha family phage regulatory protein
MTNSLVPVVTLQNGKPMCNSRDVAELFDKQHKHVLFAIRDIASQLTAEISAVWFMPTKVDQKVGFGVRKVDAFSMTRDGFALLAMGFTGKKALQFKVAYIQRFNEMEDTLRSAVVSTGAGRHIMREFVSPEGSRYGATL